MAETGTTETSVIDVREAVKDLEKYGLTKIQANGIVIFHLKTTENHVATKWDLRAMEARVDTKFAKAGFTKVDTGDAGFRVRMDDSFAKFRTDIFTWLVIIQFAMAALIIAIVK